MALPVFTILVVCVAVLLVVALVKSRYHKMESKRCEAAEQAENGAIETITTAKKSLSGPKGYPLIGSLYRLGGAGGPFEAFTQMAREYGEIYKIQLGVSKCVIVSSYRLIKEVLIAKGSHFGGRPDFMRFHQLFGGDRNNSLALCDWSDLQRKRRSIARIFCSPRGGSDQLQVLSATAVHETSEFLAYLNDESNSAILAGQAPIKPAILTAVANMFSHYMCSTRFGYDDERFNQVVRTFDEIFWDINQGYGVDFLPWLRIFYTRHMQRLNQWANDIRGFILKQIIEPRRDTLDRESGVPRDFTDALLLHLESPASELSWDHIMFELEDFIGGHSAVGNLVMMVFAQMVSRPDVQAKIQEECDSVLRQKLADGAEATITLNDRKDMPYTESVIWETLRLSSSPIVPHVATIDTDIDGYAVSKDSVIFVNNYELNIGESYWGCDSRLFRPERFLQAEQRADGTTGSKVVKPEFFIPFSTGKRTCIGQRLVQGCSFVLITAMLSNFKVSSPEGVDVKSILRPSCVAVPPDCFNLVLKHRTKAA